MKRSPMKRSPFARTAPADRIEQAPRIKPVAVPLTRPVNYGPPANDAVFAVPKREYIRSRPLLDACRLIPCQHCGRAVEGTVCAAHSNFSEHGKGGHIKADDSCIAALCDLCHVPILDQGSKLTRAERRTMWHAAHVKTVHELTSRALWPVGVPIPDTSNFS